MDLSIVIPVFNEENNLKLLIDSLDSTLKSLNYSYEILFIDDGSTDNSFDILKKISMKNKHVCIIKLKRNRGQTNALNLGFQFAKGDLIITMDGDLQNDPKDIPHFINKINQGYDVVVGWRFNRKDPFFSKKIPSKFANLLRRILTGENLHDSGCTFKIFRNYTVKNLVLHTEMHRFIPTILRFEGYKIGEIRVVHHNRKYGITKYNSTRLLRGFFDLVNVLFWYKYSKKPIHFFGKLSLLLFFVASLIFVINLFVNFFIFHVPLNVGPLLLFSVMLVLASIQLFVLGFVAEMLCRIYYSKEDLDKNIDVFLNIKNN